jgi:hypothetical protein
MKVFYWVAQAPGLSKGFYHDRTQEKATLNRIYQLENGWKVGPIRRMTANEFGLRGDGRKRGPKAGDYKIGKCDFCRAKKTITLGHDPYTHDLDGNDTLYWICSECIAQRAGDI